MNLAAGELMRRRTRCDPGAPARCAGAAVAEGLHIRVVFLAATRHAVHQPLPLFGAQHLEQFLFVFQRKLDHLELGLELFFIGGFDGRDVERIGAVQHAELLALVYYLTLQVPGVVAQLTTEVHDLLALIVLETESAEHMHAGHARVVVFVAAATAHHHAETHAARHHHAVAHARAHHLAAHILTGLHHSTKRHAHAARRVCQGHTTECDAAEQHRAPFA